MVLHSPFALDHWRILNQAQKQHMLTMIAVRKHKPLCRVSLVGRCIVTAERLAPEWQWIDSCVSPLKLGELKTFSDNPSGPDPLDAETLLDYGPVLGSRSLRENIVSALSLVQPAPITWEEVLVTTGAILANFLVLDTLLNPGDHVICQYPTYGPLIDVPRRAGADVDLWKSKAENGWVPDPAELKGLVRENTKLIIITNPNNPTGAAIPRSVLQEIVNFAAERHIVILADEVFSPMFHGIDRDDKEYPPSLLCMGYENVIVTGSMSKAYALPGVRVGWIASPMKSVLEKLIDARDYTTISVSQLDDRVAAYALSEPVRSNVLSRSSTICRKNLSLLEDFVIKHKDTCSWVKPTGACTAFVKIVRNGQPIDDDAFCQDLLRETGVMVVPGGHCFGTDGDYRGYLRIGIVAEPAQMAKGLEILGGYLGS